MKWGGFFLLVTLLSAPGLSLASANLTGISNGGNIDNPVNIVVTLDNLSDLGTQIPANSQYWGLEITIDGSNFYPQLCVPVNELVYNWTGNLPLAVNDSYEVKLYGSNDFANCGVGNTFNEGWVSITFDEFTCTGFWDPFGEMCFTDFNPLSSGTITINEYIAPPVTVNEVWGAGGLFGTSTNMASIVASGVTATGANIWTLFIFLGVLVAIYIAIKVQDFIMLSFAPVEAPKTKKRRGVDRTGDYKAFKRGKKELPGLWKD